MDYKKTSDQTLGVKIVVDYNLMAFLYLIDLRIDSFLFYDIKATGL